MMNNAGIKNIGDQVITTPVTGLIITDGVSPAGVAQEFIDELDGMLAATLSLRFAYGSGGTSVKAWVQTSFDQGSTWVDIACAAFTNATKAVLFNLSGLTPKTTVVVPTDGTLADDTAVDGWLGDRLRVKVTSLGNYQNTTLSCRATVR